MNGRNWKLFEPLDFIRHILVPNPCGATFGRANRLSYRFVISRLAALVPKPRVHLTRFHGVFAPHSKYRARVTPAKRGKSTKKKPCSECGGDVRIIASIEDPAVINKILTHLDEKAATAWLPQCRAPPATGWFD